MKKYKNNRGYFDKWEGLKTFGLGMSICGFVIVWAIWQFFYIGVMLLAVGFACFLIGNTGRSTESEIMDEIGKKCRDLDFKEIETDRYLQKRVPEKVQEYVFEGFRFADGLCFKKKKDGSVVTSEYIYAKLLLLTDGLYIKCRGFSLLSDEVNEETVDILAKDIEAMEVVRTDERYTYRKKEYHVKPCRLSVTYDSGKQILLPMNDDVYADEFVAKLKKKIGI